MLKNIFSFQLFIFCSCDFCFQSIFRPLVLQTKAILLNLFQRKRNDSSFFKRTKSAKKLVAFIGSTKNKNGHKMYRPKYVCEIKRGNVKIVCVLFVVVLFAQANYTIHKIHQQISHLCFCLWNVGETAYIVMSIVLQHDLLTRTRMRGGVINLMFWFIESTFHTIFFDKF